MPHFSADLLDAILDGDPAELEALRGLLGMPSGRCALCRPAPLIRLAPGPTDTVPAATHPRRRRPAGEAEARERRPRSSSSRPAPVPRRRPLPG